MRPEPGTRTHRAALAAIISLMVAAMLLTTFQSTAARAAEAAYTFICGAT